MDFGHTPEEADFRDHVRDHLRGMVSDAEMSGADERPLYRRLGAAGLLGVAWPVEYGGQGRSTVFQSIVSEEIVRAGIPDALFVNGILTVGRLVLNAGTPAQRSRLLPGLASGEIFAGVLYTEPEAGSDLAALSTTAIPVKDGFVLSGTKVFGLKSGIADVGLCAARVPGRGGYAEITLFLVDMRAEGVHITALDGLPEERFHVVELDDVRVTPDDVVGGLGNGWSMVLEALPYERIGFDFSIRAERWYGLVRQTGDDPADTVTSARYAARVEAARLLSWKASAAVDSVSTSVAKWYGSELAAELAGWAVRKHAPDIPAEVERAYREAPGLTLSGGTSEMMLQTLAQHLPDTVDRVG
ncbi:acyl-CoA dehydrogenase family protein [Kibdelosporangium persicum]|uniref:Butyryl-CoA dehydrogenase n=1 Tax=Kibdelosporangium persicum TaxID=2698649 RepID=A0ABX2FI51_9PSEU|nr:acyl-CoA dehydrogenase family protein [Kibdelosporangium persicum]NRN71089.1 Butyryl-CoA dehydrogenase [Kibdelosporangium persicum]